MLADGVRVGVRRGDERSAGFDPDRSELIVYGELVQEGAASFFSTASRPGALDWAGLFLMDGQGLDEETLDVQNARFGTVRARLPSGLTTWRGTRQTARRCAGARRRRARYRTGRTDHL